MMRKIASQFEDSIRTGFIKGHEVMHALLTTVMRLLNWSLPAITISEEECTHTMAPIIKYVLAKMQIVTSIKRDVIYGPIHLQRMGFKNLYTQIGAMHISLLLQFYDTDTDLGRLLQNTLECLTIELGTQSCPFILNYEKYEKCTTSSWIKHLWKFCFEQQVTLKCNKTFFPGRRANDRNLIQCFIDNGLYGSQLASINRCQLYLQVLNLSDITKGDGLRIDKSSYSGLQIRIYVLNTCGLFKVNRIKKIGFSGEEK